MKEKVTVLTSLPQEHCLVLAVIDRLLENDVSFRGFLDNRIPDRFSPEHLESDVILLDRGIFEKMSDEEKKMLADYSLKHVVVCYDYCGDKENRTLCNFDTEITVNGALSKADIGRGEVPEQDPEVMCRFARERAEAYLDSDGLSFSEFTLHHLRALAMEKELVLRVLPKLFDSQDPEFIPQNHDVLGAWCYAPLCSRLTGDGKYNKKFLHILDRTMAARPYSPEGIMGGAGNVADPLSCRGPHPLWGAHCAGREKVIYNEMFHFHGPVFAAATLASGDRRYLDHAMKLMRYLRDHAVDPADGLPCHYCYRGQRRGAKWSRGIAHILHGIALMFEVWPDLPEAEAKELAAFADSIGDGVLRTQSPGGLWHNIADEEKSPLETSGTMAFVAAYRALTKARLLSEDKYGDMIRKGRSGLLRRCYRGGFAGNCSGTGFSPNMDYYFRRPFNFLFTGQIVPALEGDC